MTSFLCSAMSLLKDAREAPAVFQLPDEATLDGDTGEGDLRSGLGL